VLAPVRPRVGTDDAAARAHHVRAEVVPHFFGEVINSAQNPSLDEITISLIKATISR
jgi:hypothetical protein